MFFIFNDLYTETFHYVNLFKKHIINYIGAFYHQPIIYDKNMVIKYLINKNKNYLKIPIKNNFTIPIKFKEIYVLNNENKFIQVKNK